MPFLATTNPTPYSRQTRKLLEAQGAAAAQARRERNFKILLIVGSGSLALVVVFLATVYGLRN